MPSEPCVSAMTPAADAEDPRLGGNELSLRAFSLAALGLGIDQPTAPEELFLRRCVDDVVPPDGTWDRVFSGYLDEPNLCDRPLLDLASILQLSAVETLTAALAAAVEDDVMVGRAIAHLQAPVGGSRPTVGLMAAAFGAWLVAKLFWGL